MGQSAGTWMPLYIGDYLADTMHLNGAEHGAYLLLIMHYWRNGPLPDCDRALAAIARTDRAEWEGGISTIVRAFFKLRDGRLHHKRIEKEFIGANAAVAKRVEAGRKAGLASAAQREAQRKINGSSSNGPTVAPTIEARSSTPSPSPIKKEETSLRDAKKIGRRLPEAWEPSPSGVQFAEERGLDVTETLAHFRDYWRAAAGRNANKLDWDATWRTWCRNARKPGRDRPMSDLAEMTRAMFQPQPEPAHAQYEFDDPRGALQGEHDRAVDYEAGEPYRVGQGAHDERALVPLRRNAGQ